MGEILKFAMDTEKEDQGVWVQYPGTDIEFRIARMGNPKYLEFKRKLSRPFSRQITKAVRGEGDFPAREMEEAEIKAVAKTILLGWRNLELNGKSIEYTPEKAEEILSDRRFRPILNWITEASEREDAYRQEDLDSQSKN